MEAYLAGIEARAARGLPVKPVASVASFFVSRIDTLLDPQLEIHGTRDRDKEARAQSLRGKVAIASAKLAYQNLQGNLRQPTIYEARRAWCPASAVTLGQHQHQEPGLWTSVVFPPPARVSG